MKITIVGNVHGQARYKEIVDLGTAARDGGNTAEPVKQAMDRIRDAYFKDHPFDPFTESPLEGTPWPDLTYSYATGTD